MRGIDDARGRVQYGFLAVLELPDKCVDVDEFDWDPVGATEEWLDDEDWHNYWEFVENGIPWEAGLLLSFDDI